MSDTLPPRPPVARGRGATVNPAGRFERLAVDDDPTDDLPGQRPTEVYRDTSRSILSTNDSPDVGMSVTLNPYRGCEHGCIYCYARPTHEYLGLSAGVDFESRLFAKVDAPELLRRALMRPSWKPEVISLSGITDPYQPIERAMKLTRQCLKVLAEFKNPVSIVTKNHLVTRDIDVLGELAAHQAACVFVSITTLDGDLARVMEPRASRPDKRLEAIRRLREAGIPAGVMVAPIIPGLTDHEVPAIVEAAAQAGAMGAGYTVVRLPYGIKDLFDGWLAEHRPLRREKVLNRIREVRGGKLNDARFGSRMKGEGLFAEQIRTLFFQSRRRFGLDGGMPPLSAAAFARPAAESPQLSLL